jgi:hypothetical protein
LGIFIHYCKLKNGDWKVIEDHFERKLVSWLVKLLSYGETSSYSRGDIEISFVGTKDQLVNIFKPLNEGRFRQLRHELNIIDSTNVA